MIPVQEAFHNRLSPWRAIGDVPDATTRAAIGWGIGPARRIALAFVATIALALAACSLAKEAAQGTFAPASPGVLVVATELPAPGFWDSADPSTVHGGFEWALADALAKELHLTLSVRAVPFDEITAGHLGDADMAIAQVSITAERRDHVDLSIPYLLSSPAALVRDVEGEPDIEIADLATAKEKRWVVQRGTTDEQYLHDIIRPDDDPVVVATQDEAVQVVASGSADAALLDLPSALVIAHDRPGLRVPARFDRDEDLAAVLPKGSSNTQVVDRALRALIADGTVDELRRRWLDPAFATDPDSIPVIRART
jgi:polar amino acid transport system substrate-binding protein